jgi:hypothetical protein
MTAENPRSFLANFASNLRDLRENTLLSDAQFTSFCRMKSISVSGANADLNLFEQKGLLRSDATDESGSWFHPFRIYTMHEIQDSLRLPVDRSSLLFGEKLISLVQDHITRFEQGGWLQKRADNANRISELCELLEPIYWPRITGASSRSENPGLDPQATTNYTYSAKCYIQTLSPDEWEHNHSYMRRVADQIDENGSLYLMLRLSSWEQRRKLKGSISLGLWIRHMAEVIRLGFEETHNVKWKEEDRFFGFWIGKGREILYGSDRPLDTPDKTRTKLAFLFRVNTGSAARWYVEGHTEYYAIRELIPDLSEYGVELYNMMGAIKDGRNNLPLKVSELLDHDLASQRFSIFTIDGDVLANIDWLRNQVVNSKIYGNIYICEPDFELANFTVGELVLAACQMHKEDGYDHSCLQDVDWSGISSGRDFERRYETACSRSLKGPRWGRALGRYIANNPCKEGSDQPRPIVGQAEIATAMRSYDYDLHRKGQYFDENTFEVRYREPLAED